jgi:hypothetical protein
MNDREFAKFVETAGGEVAIRVILSGTSTLVTLTMTGMLYQSVESGIVAGTTQTQAGATALTKMINEIATCANANDGVKLVTAAIGAQQTVINNGVANLKIWPASGDDLGAGVDTAITVPPGSKSRFDAWSNTKWKVG